MVYMIYQQYKTAVKAAYRGSNDIDRLFHEAQFFREWLESLAIDQDLRDVLVEQVKALEEGFEELVIMKDPTA